MSLYAHLMNPEGCLFHQVEGIGQLALLFITDRNPLHSVNFYGSFVCFQCIQICKVEVVGKKNRHVCNVTFNCV